MTRERLLTIALLIGAGLLAGAVYRQRREIKRLGTVLDQKDAEIRRLGDGTIVVKEVRGAPETVLVAAERAGFDVGALQADLNDHGATLRAVLNASASTEGSIASDLTGSPVLGASTATQLPIREQYRDSSIAWGRVTYDVAAEKPWTLEQFSRTYSARVALAEREDGSQFAYVGMTIATDSERLELEPTSVELATTPGPKRWRWGAWPMLTLDGGLHAGSVEWLPGAAVAFATLGERAREPEWTFLGAGLAYGVVGRRVALSLAPVSYTLRSVLPVLSTSVGPAVFFDERGSITYALGLRVFF